MNRRKTKTPMTHRAIRNRHRQLDPTFTKGEPTPSRPEKSREPVVLGTENGRKLSNRKSKRYQRQALALVMRERERNARAYVLGLIERRQKAAKADLAVSLWERRYPGAKRGDRRLDGKFIPKKPEKGVWP